MSEEKSILQRFALGTCSLILEIMGRLSYSLTWAILFVVFTNRELKNPNYNPICDDLIKWDKAVYILHFVAIGMTFVIGIIEVCMICSERMRALAPFSFLARSGLVSLAEFAILIGINVVYFRNPDISECNSLKGLNLAYIITEWIKYGFICCCLGCICCLTCCTCCAAIAAGKGKS